MAISLADIKRSTQLPPRVVLYGVPGIGKTTLASKAPNPIFIPTEDGFGTLDVPTFPKPNDLAGVLDCIETLLAEEHDYQTVVLDSLDKTEPLIWDFLCATVPHEKGHAVDRIEGYGYGKGYKHALNEWRMLLRGFDALRNKGMAVILIAHSTVEKVESPESDAYDRYQLALHKWADACIVDWCDALLFCNYKISVVSKANSERKRAVGKGERVVYTQERPAFRAKNRYGMPEQLPLAPDSIYPFLFPQAAK